VALVSCPECGKQVSDKAANCIGCGAPLGANRVEVGAIGKQVSTIEETSKSLKMHIVGAAILFWGGLFILWSASSSGSGGLGHIGAWATLIGFFWWLATRLRIWWHHK
jgi:hypothetical protein